MKSFGRNLDDFDELNMYGHNIVCSDGPQWAKYRKACASSFSEKNLQTVWDSTTRLMHEVFSNWSAESENEVRIPVIRTFTLKVCLDSYFRLAYSYKPTTQIALLIMTSAGFGQPTHWEDDESGNSQIIDDALHSLVFKFVFPRFFWGTAAQRDELAVAGLAGRGWLGKRVLEAAKALSRLHVRVSSSQSEHNRLKCIKKLEQYAPNAYRAADHWSG